MLSPSDLRDLETQWPDAVASRVKQLMFRGIAIRIAIHVSDEAKEQSCPRKARCRRQGETLHCAYNM